MEILAISGSLRNASSNTALLHAAALLAFARFIESQVRWGAGDNIHGGEEKQ